MVVVAAACGVGDMIVGRSDEQRYETTIFNAGWDYHVLDLLAPVLTAAPNVFCQDCLRHDVTSGSTTMVIGMVKEMAMADDDVMPSKNRITSE